MDVSAATVAGAMLFGVLMPPAEFDRAYTGPLEIEYAAPADVNALCATGRYVRACAIIGDGWCKIILPKDTGVYPRKTLELLMRHEIAHCNGWEH